MTKVYNKLVRDRIPEIIEDSGKTCLTTILDEEAYLHMLDQKLNEELAEYQESKSIEELADLIEVIASTAKARGYSWDRLMKIRDKKHQERGGFDKRILLLEVTEKPRTVALSDKPANAGKPWTAEAETELCKMYDEGSTTQELCDYFQRTRSGIAARLVRLGKILERSELK